MQLVNRATYRCYHFGKEAGENRCTAHIQVTSLLNPNQILCFLSVRF